MEGKQEQPATGSSRVSFTFQKKSSSQKVKPAVNADTAREQTDFVFSLEGKEVQSSKPQASEKEYIIPYIGKNKWRLPPGGNKSESSSTKKDERSEEEIALEKEAAQAVLKDFQEAQLRGSEGGDEDMLVPLILQNKPPLLEGKEDDELADIELRPEQSTLEEYDSMPIDKFGEAMLRGMGWKKGDAIGKTNKGLTEPIEFIPRMGGLGLGATPRAPTDDKKRKIKKPGEEEKKVHGPYRDKDGRVKHYKKVGEDVPEPELEGFCVGNYARVCIGPHEDLVGKIVSVDDDTAHVVLKLTINNQMLRFSQHHLELVVKEDKHRQSQEERDRHHHNQSDKKEKKYGLIKKGQNRSPSPVGEKKRSKHSQQLESSKRDSRTHAPSPKRAKRDDTDGREDELNRRLNDSDTAVSHSKSRSDEAHHHSKKPRTKDHHEDKHRSSDQVSKYGQKSSSRHRDVNDSRHRDRDADRTGSEHYKSKVKRVDKLTEPRKESWLSSNLRVRIIDQQFKKGRYYNTKVVIVDVVSLDNCICQTEDGKLLEGVTQSMLETVVPRSTGAHIMLVGGKRKGQLATIIEQERPKAKATVETVLSKEVIKVHFDDVCEYVGDIEDY